MTRTDRVSTLCSLVLASFAALSAALVLAGARPARAQTPTAAPPPVGPQGDADGVHAVLCLSGGGTRAAAFAHGAALGLADASTLERVDRVVGVSGGSLTATQVAIDRRPEALARFEREVLRADLEGAMVRAAARQLFALMGKDLTRCDVAARCFDDRLRATSFAALPARPELWVQTTDMVTRRPRVLSRRAVEELGMDPARFTVGRAIAASAAVPGIFPPLRVEGVAGPSSTLYLGDGGIVDNLGLEPALESAPPGARAVVVFVVDARRALPASEATLRSSIRAGLHTVALQQRRLDELVLARARDRLRLLELEARLEGRALDTRLVMIDFAASSRREALDAIGTRFALSDDEVTLLIEEGRAVARARAAAVADVWRP